MQNMTEPLFCLVDPDEYTENTEKKNQPSLFQNLTMNFQSCLNELSVHMESRKREIFGQFTVAHTNSVSIQVKLSFKQICEERIIFLGQGICYFKDKSLRLQSKALIDTFSRYCTHYMSSLKLGKLSCYESGLIYFRIDVDQVSQCIISNMANFLFTIIKTIKGTLEGQISRILYFYQQFSITDAFKFKEYFKLSAKQDTRNVEPKPFQEKQINFLKQQIDGLKLLATNQFQVNQEYQNSLKNLTELQGKSQKQKMIQEIVVKSSLDQIENKKVSQGGFAEIYRESLEYVIDECVKKREFIIKRSKNRENNEKILHEIEIMRHLNSKPMNHKGREYLIQYYEDVHHKGHLFLDPMQHFGMDNFNSKFKEVISIYTKIHLLYQLSIALHFLHKNNCVHLDLKPGNILISRSWQIRLIDFGEAKILDKNSRNDVRCRTLPYAAPEFFLKPETITTAYDIFSFGVIMHQLLFDEYPFQYHESKEQSFIEILKRGDLDKYLIIQDLHLKKYGHSDIISPLVELIKQCLKHNPRDRPSINGVVQALGYCFDYLRGFYF